MILHLCSGYVYSTVSHFSLLARLFSISFYPFVLQSVINCCRAKELAARETQICMNFWYRSLGGFVALAAKHLWMISTVPSPKKTKESQEPPIFFRYAPYSFLERKRQPVNNYVDVVDVEPVGFGIVNKNTNTTSA
jgi:hypothetical protein